MKTTTLPSRDSISCAPLRLAFLLIPLLLACFALSPPAEAVCQEGCLTNNNTALGEDALLNNTGLSNTAIGFGALYFNTTGQGNTATGLDALAFNTTGSSNTATGAYTLNSNTIGSYNTATGYEALNNNTGSNNTATGFEALNNNTGSNNTATGSVALFSNTSGADNTAHGYQALYDNTTGSRNVAFGSYALLENQTGSDNTATGVNALYHNTANYNTAYGYQALESNTTGTNNTANGLNALNKNVIGSYNAAQGAYALYNNTTGNNNAACGSYALYSVTTGRSNIALGYDAGHNVTTGSYNIEIGNGGLRGESATIRIGSSNQTNTYISGIYGATAAGGIAVFVDSSGHLGTTTSSARFKENIQAMDKASEVILALKPVSFHYKKKLDPEGIPQFGLVAEEVEKVNPDLVARDEDGKPYSVRYEAVNAMLLNEFLKEHKKVEQLETTVAKLESVAGQQKHLQTTVARQQEQIERLTAALKEQANQIQKVSAQLQVSKAASQLIANDR